MLDLGLWDHYNGKRKGLWFWDWAKNRDLLILRQHTSSTSLHTGGAGGTAR